MTVFSMLDSTPDWFIDLTSYSLLSGGEWRASHTVDMYPCDSGTEEGTEYSQFNPASDPHVPIFSIRGRRKFAGASAPVGRLRFELEVPKIPINLTVSGARAAEGGAALDVTATLGSANDSGSALIRVWPFSSSATTFSASRTRPSR